MHSTLSLEEVQEVLRLAGGSDTVEIKLAIPMEAHRATFKSLSLDPIEAEPRQVFFFDTPTMALGRAGLLVRARRSQGGAGDTVVKLRPVEPTMIDKELRSSEDFKVEVDVMPGGFVCSASAKSRCSADDVLEAAEGGAGLKSLLSKEQRAFYRKHAPAKIALDALVPFGPTFVLKAKVQPEHFERGLTVELWLFPDGSRTVELSTKAEPADALQVVTELRSFLKLVGIEIVAGQQTKTQSAMAFFRAEMRRGRRVPTRRPGRGVARRRAPSSRA